MTYISVIAKMASGCSCALSVGRWGKNMILFLNFWHEEIIVGIIGRMWGGGWGGQYFLNPLSPVHLHGDKRLSDSDFLLWFCLISHPHPLLFAYRSVISVEALSNCADVWLSIHPDLSENPLTFFKPLSLVQLWPCTHRKKTKQTKDKDISIIFNLMRVV